MLNQNKTGDDCNKEVWEPCEALQNQAWEEFDAAIQNIKDQHEDADVAYGICIELELGIQ